MSVLHALEKPQCSRLPTNDRWSGSLPEAARVSELPQEMADERDGRLHCEPEYSEDSASQAAPNGDEFIRKRPSGRFFLTLDEMNELHFGDFEYTPFQSRLILEGRIRNDHAPEIETPLRREMRAVRVRWVEFCGSPTPEGEIRCLIAELKFRNKWRLFLRAFPDVTKGGTLSDAQNFEQINGIRRRLCIYRNWSNLLEQRARERSAFARYQKYRRSVAANP